MERHLYQVQAESVVLIVKEKKMWPEYHQMSELGEGWQVLVQSKEGKTYDQFFRDPIMAETSANKWAKVYGMELPLTVHWKSGRSVKRTPK